MSNSNKIKGISRRDFLKGTAAGALGVAAAGLLGGCASTPENRNVRHVNQHRPLLLQAGRQLKHWNRRFRWKASWPS